MAAEHAKKAVLTRRRFLGTAGAAAGAFTIVPRHVLGGPGRKAPSDKLNIAGIGVGGMGGNDIRSVGGENVVALCDVDDRRVGESIKRLPDAKRFRDFRKMLDEMDKDIDAVTVGTPDHTHAVAAMAAIRRGKHVYCEKPLAHSIGEVRKLMAAAREHKVVTQLGNQGHSSESIRTFCEWIRDGAIGKVHTIHAGCGSVYSRIRDLGRLGEKHDVPSGLDWDLWLGPAQERPYHPMFLPGSWRGWLPFGTGVIGDWVCHVVDPVFWALDLGAPATIEARAEGYDPARHGLTCPMGTVIKYGFAATAKRPAVTLFWYDGTEKLPRPEKLEAERKVVTTGAVVLGEKDGIMYGSHGAGGCRIFPEASMKAYQRPEKTLPRARGHQQDWLEAIRKGTQAGSDFSYGGPLTEIALLGVIAFRMLGKELHWDAKSMRFTNCDEANAYVDPPYRKGWSL